MNAAYSLDNTTEQSFDVRALNASASVLFAVAGLVFVGLALAALARLPLFTIRAVQIDGEVSRNSVTTIRANAITKLAGNFFSVNLAHSKQAFESVPWVRHAIVSRVWPNGLHVTLEEHHAAAYWHREDGDDQLVNQQGEVFTANLGDVEDDNLPTLQGPDGSSAQMLALLHQLETAFQSLRLHVDTLRMSERGSWAVTLDDGSQIELGRGTEAELMARVQRYVSTISQVTAHYRGPVEAADLRYTQGYALRVRGVTTLPAGASAPANKTHNQH